MRKNKFNNLFCGLALTAFVGAGLASCTSELDGPSYSDTTSGSLVGAPKVIAYSGDHYWTGSGSRELPTRSGEDFNDVVSYQTVWKDAGAIDYNAETQTVSSILGEGTNNIDLLDVDFMYHAEEDITFEMFPVYQHTSHSPNYLGVFYYDTEGQLHKQIVWDRIDLYNFQDWQNNGGKSKGVRISIRKGYKFGFFIEGYDNSWTLTDYYSLSELNPDLAIYGGSGTSKTHAGTFEHNGKTYLCFEDWTDFDYQDIVFAAFSHLPTVDEDDLLPDPDVPSAPDRPTLPDTPTVPETPDNGDGGDNDGPVNPGNPGGDNDNPANPALKGHNEVEINLALDGKANKALVSHLSIHVRYATDVEVFIPVPAQYYCDTDDMNIILDKEQQFVHGGPYTTEFKVGDNTVYLNVEFQDGGIKVYTDGINRDVIDYCREYYLDGITFEIWNYFNDPEKVGDFPISTEELKQYLDRATVRFLDEVPPRYVNAFGSVNGKYGEGGSPAGNDFHVTPEEHLSNFNDPVVGPHLNGSSNNEIFLIRN